MIPNKIRLSNYAFVRMYFSCLAHMTVFIWYVFPRQRVIRLEKQDKTNKQQQKPKCPQGNLRLFWWEAVVHGLPHRNHNLCVQKYPVWTFKTANFVSHESSSLSEITSYKYKRTLIDGECMSLQNRFVQMNYSNPCRSWEKHVIWQ